MRNDRHLAVQLRKQGKSYASISRTLTIPKSTLSNWFANECWSQEVRRLLAKKAQDRSGQRIGRYSSLRWAAWRAQARQEAKRSFGQLQNNPLFIAGLMLYWGEGDTNPKNPVRIANTDPRMIKLFVKFLCRVVHIPFTRLRIFLILYNDLSEKTCINYWSQITRLPLKQFNKTQYIRGRHPTKRLSYGICYITYGSRQLKEKMLTWIDMAQQHL